MKKLLVPLVLIALGLVALITIGVLQGGVPEMQARDFSAATYGDRTVKVHGLLEKIESAERPLRFTMSDKEDPAKVIAVYADKTRPDTFQETYDVAVEGRWDADRNALVADKIFTKCPSKYEAEAKQGIGNAKDYEAKIGKKAPAEPVR